jgi:hypothetical protein
MSFLRRNFPGLVAVTIGVVSGIYMWKPALEELKAYVVFSFSSPLWSISRTHRVLFAIE